MTSVNCPHGLPRSAMGGPMGAPMGAPYGVELPPEGATWAPLRPLWGGIAPKRRHMGPLGPYGPDLPPSPPGRLLRSSQGRFFPGRKPLFSIFGPKMGPLWGGIAPRRRHMGPLGPLMGRNYSQKALPTWVGDHFCVLRVLSMWGTIFVSLGCCPGGGPLLCP